MPSMADVLKRKVDALVRRIDESTGVFEVATTSPFTVYLNGDETTPVPARAVPGLTYSVGTTGEYLLTRQGQQPLCVPTTTTP